MEQKFCQSCGMPLNDHNHGTNADGPLNDDYCIYCYKNGKFTQDMTMEQMIDHCARFTDEINKQSGQNLTQEQAKEMMRRFFPHLKRWKEAIAMLFLPLTLLLSSVNAYALNGSWRGDLNLGQIKVPLVFNFSETESGETQCTLDSPSQGAKGIATEVVHCSADSIALTCNVIGGSYTGKISADRITGLFQQRGYTFPLNLTPDIPIEERRPQTPKPPFPYSVTDTTFAAPDGAIMSATLTLPRSADSKKIPAVVMVTGSGPQNRDEEYCDHKPFAVIADFLARNGIASLRYDDRGTGKSGGNYLTSTTYTIKDDAVSGLEMLRSIPCIGDVGVLGHSEGGTIAIMIGAEDKADFIVSLAGMAVSGKETLMRQNSHNLDKMSLSDTDKANSIKLIELGFDAIITQVQKGQNMPVDIDALAADNNLRVPEQILQSLKMTQSTRAPWFDAFLVLNPREYLGKVKCPVLAINGEKDKQVYPDNLTVIKEYIPHAETLLMPELNHLMQHAVTGEMTEYDEIRETISPDVLDAIVRFIRNTCVNQD